MKNMKLSLKLVLGFGAVLVLTGVVAFIGYNGLNNVIHRVEIADDATHINEYMLDIRRQEKNFQLRGFTLWGSDIQNAVEKLDDLVVELETQIEETRAKLTEQQSIDALASISQKLSAYKAAFDEYVSLETNKYRSDAQMVVAARIVIEVTEEIRIDQKEKLYAEMDAGAEVANLQDRLQKADDANRLIKWMLEARRHEKNYILRQEQKYADNIDSNIADMLTLLEDMKVRFKDTANDAQADQVISALRDYEQAFGDYVDAVAAQAEQETAMVTAARATQAGAEDLRQAQQEAMLNAESSAITMMLSTAGIAILFGIVAMAVITLGITKPVASLQRIAKQIAQGNTQVTIDIDQKDEIGQLANTFKRMAAVLNDVLAEAVMVVDAEIEGKLDVRGDVTKFEGDFARLVQGVNDTLEAVGAPLNVAIVNFDRISKDEIPDNITDEYKGDYNEVKNNLNGMIAYLTEMSNAANSIAERDLTVEVTPLSARDVLGNAFSQMIANLRELIGQVIDNANNVGAAARQLNTAAEQSGNATSQIAATIQQVAMGTQQQTESTTITAGSVEQMSRAIDGVAQGAQEQAAAVGRSSEITAQITAAIQQVAANAQSGAEGAAQAAHDAHDGSAIVENNINAMQNIKSKVDLSAQKVHEMGQRSEQIGAIVEAIDDIASQTNLLALNAAIEAARAGEHGKGFAVVAEEVRKLAEKSAGATKEIADLIKGIQKTVAEAVDAMNESAIEVEAGVTGANESGQALTSILEAIETVNQQTLEIAGGAQQISASADELVSAMDSVSAVVEENTASTEEMAAGSNEVTQAIENIASVSEENSAAVEEVSAGAEEMSAQVEEVTASAQSLSEMAQSLQQLVAQFKLKDDEE